MQELYIKRISSDTFAFEGVITGDNFDKLYQLENNNNVIFIDFGKVTDITFSGIRCINKSKNRNGKICFYNLSDNLYCKINDSGVLKHIELIRKSLELSSLDDYEPAGEGFKAVTYFGKDNETVLKIYKKFISADVVIKDKYFASVITGLGVATPIVGNLVDYNGRHGIIFERIHGKKSYSRALADNFDDMPNIIKRYAKECKKLHSIKCNTSCLPSANDIFINVVNNSKILNSDEKQKVINALNRIEDTKCCLHGDMHYGNLIFTEDKDSLFIDLGDFASGNYMYDIGILCLNTFFIPPELVFELYHINREQMIKCWDIFVREYFETSDQDYIDKITYEAQFFASLKILLYAERKFYPWMRSVIEKYLLNRIK